MNARVKLLTLWDGPLPDWYSRFREQVCVNWEVIDHEILDFSTKFLNSFATNQLGSQCRKESHYAMCDLRPMYGEVFSPWLVGYEWWGWVELDVVLGDLNRLLPPLLDTHDAVSVFPSTVSGPLFMIRNVPRCNKLFRQGDWETVLAEPSYCNFEEVQGAHVAGFHKDGGFTKLLRESGLPVHWDDRYSLRDDPAAGCRFEDGRLLETPSGRELMMYHFNHTKRWPL